MSNILSSFYTIRFNDCDPFGHLNNAAYLNYFINARMDQVNEAYKEHLAPLYKSGKGWVVAKHEIRYLIPAVPEEKVCIKSLLLNYTIDSLFVEMTMWNEKTNKLKALLWSKLVHVSMVTGKKIEHPDEFMEFLSNIKISEIDYSQGFEVRLTEIKSYEDPKIISTN